MLRTALFVLLVLFASPLAADTNTEIRNALSYYAQVWNENDIEAIEGYYHQDFIQVGNEGTLTRQQQIDGIRNLLGSGDDPGTLAISDITVKQLGDGHAMAWGKISLSFKDGSSLDSWFTTVYIQTPFGWKALLTRN